MLVRSNILVATRTLLKYSYQLTSLLLCIDHIIDTIVETSDAVFGSEEKTIRQLLDTNEDTQGVRKVQDKLKTVKYAPGYQLTFSLFSGDASNGVREWKMQEVIHGKAVEYFHQDNGMINRK
jgi:hypothetical protein